MIYIRKEQEPTVFTEYRLTERAHFDDLPGNVKVILRKSLLKEQGYLCAYCMQAISEDCDVKIEHYQARNAANELEYRNLFAVCNGNEGSPYKELTCDSRKGNKDLQIDPQNAGDMKTIAYQSIGTIHSTNEHYDEEMNGILNLNYEHGYLISNRKAALLPIKRDLAKLTDKKDCKRRIERMLQHYAMTNAESKYPEYVGIIRWYLQKKRHKYAKC